MQIGKHFTLSEFTISQTAVRRNIPNIPTAKEIAALKALCANLLDPLRGLLGKPIVISSGYRTPKLNRILGGSATSQHCKGEAADIIVPGMTVDEVVKRIIASGLPFDQLINEYNAWTHVSFSIARARRQTLKAVRTGNVTRYIKM